MQSTVRNDRDMLSGVGTTFEILRTLQGFGVTDVDWRNILRSHTHAQRVAAAIIGRRVPLEELVEGAIREGYLQAAEPLITEQNFPEVAVRGKYELINPGAKLGRGAYSTKALLAYMERSGLQPATMYELVHFATVKWNRHDIVVALDTVYPNPDGGKVGCLWTNQLILMDEPMMWSQQHRFLAIRE